MRILRWFIAMNLAALASICASAYEQYDAAFAFLCLVFLCNLVMLRHIWGSWVTLSHLFLTAFTLYTLSGPFEILFGSGAIPPFSPPFYVREWLVDSAIAAVSFMWAILLWGMTYRPRHNVTIRTIGYMRIALLLILFATAGEFLNLIRAGGISILLAGKAVYQAATADIKLTFPTSSFALLAFAFLGIHHSWRFAQSHSGISKGSQSFDDLLFLVLCTPLLLVHLILGQRLEIASYVAAFVLGCTYRAPVERFPTRWAVGLLLVYLLLSPLYGFRWAFPLWISGKAVDLPAETVQKLLLSSLNPAVNEFGSPFGNYSLVMQAGIADLYYGSTFLRDLTVAIPGFLYPGEKPTSITYEFRDRFFADWSSRSRISGTAFSSLLEARMNFGDLGALLVFFAYGSLLAVLEILRNRYESPWFAAFYCSFGLFALVVHRSSTGGTLSGYLWVVVILALVWAGRQIWRKRWQRIEGLSSSSSIA
ncbi:MAG: hypothetical protein KatS3mg022_2570 [Armatimonadota bacterium]|nr:MAG: hypothetical protein KatS3mg022_2570 [Armatimonadota bacterium]